MTMLSKGPTKALIAGAAGLAMIAATSVAAPTTAHAKHNLAAAFIGGAVLGAVLTAPKTVYGSPYVAYQPSCGWQWQKQFTGYYDVYGQPIYKSVKVQVCW